MTASEALELLRKMVMLYPAQARDTEHVPAAMVLYAEDLAPEFEASDLTDALRAVTRELRFLPTLAEIRAECIIARKARLGEVYELEQAEANADAIRRALASPCPSGVGATFLPKSWTPGEPGPNGALVLSSESLCGILWGHVEVTGGEALPAAIPESEREAWRIGARQRWAARMRSDLRAAESDVAKRRLRLGPKIAPARRMLR